MQGIIKFYNSNEGYGFIYSTENEKDYYFNICEWKNAILPNAGQQVEFVESNTKKGLSAKSIKLLKDVQKDDKTPDDRIICPNCSRKIVPRIQYLNHEPYASHCPYCAAKIKQFVIYTVSPIVLYSCIFALLLGFSFVIFILFNH